ncbi:mitochondrial 2-oxodicarboxylate carrier-like [Ornithodoros turicata]|uniref:mitochondrial 2-oxodicarboxylate carrier-like n=1 Tax=Ornithodoros turicata TaxID=34597 RepID=UPI00313922DA
MTSQADEVLFEIPHHQKAAVQFTAGAVAGFIEVCVNHPLDVVKTRLQMQSADDPNRYKSITNCFARMVKAEGFLSVYKGILPVLVVETPKMAVRFVVYEYCKRKLSPYVGQVATTGTAGFVAGVVEGAAVNPFEVVKVRLQTDRQFVQQQPSSYALAKQIYRSHGLGPRGLSLGMTANVFRHGVFLAIYFAVYNKLKSSAPAYKSALEENAWKMGFGVFSGCVGTCFNIPFDVAKSRIQGPQPEPGKVKYKTCWQSLTLVYKEEGFLALYKGLAPKMLRLSTGHGLIIVLYEHIVELLEAMVRRL